MVFVTNGVSIHYQSSGSGTPVLLLHGWGGRADSMRPLFNALAPFHSAYAIDFPGYGDSDFPPKPWSMDDYADATLAFMKDRGIVGCDVIGHSFGGRVIIKLAARDEHNFNRIVMTGAAGVRKRRTPGYYIRIYSYKLAKRLSKWSVTRKSLKWIGVDVQARIQNAGSEDYRALPDQMKRTFSLVVNENLRPLLKKIKNPTLLLWGEDDRETPLWVARTMEKEIPDCGLVTYPNAGHFAYLECLPQFVAVMTNFLSYEREK